MTDLHCHILPSIDDGAKDESVSLEMLRKEYEDGVRRIAFTSHFKCERTEFDEFLSERDLAFERLKKAMRNAPAKLGEIQFKLGAEVLFSPRLIEMDLFELCIGDTDFMLMELPFTHKPFGLDEALYHIQSMGVIPLIAHVERYPYVMEDPTMLYNWVAAGFLCQVNAGSLVRGDKESKFLLKLIDWGLVHVISSDAHSMGRRRPDVKSGIRYIEKKMGADYADMLRYNAEDIFNGVMPDTMDIHCPKKRFGRWV